MKISVDHGFLFVHIPRTAGSSIEGALAPYCLDERRRYPQRLLSKLGLVRDWREEHYRIHLSLGEAEKRIPASVFQGLTKFAVVRDPFDWLASRYRHRRRRVEGSPRGLRRRHVESFTGYLRWLASQIGVRPDATQLDMLTIRGNRLGMDRVLRFEALEEDWAALTRDLGIQAKLPHWNRSGPDDGRSLYDEELTDFVQEHWRRDIDLLGGGLTPPDEEV